MRMTRGMSSFAVRAAAAAALCAGAATARAQNPPAATPPAETPAPSAVRWYKILLQARHLGSASVAVTPAQEKDQALLHVVSELSYSDPDTGFPTQIRVDADLLQSTLNVLHYKFNGEANLQSGPRRVTMECTRKPAGGWRITHSSVPGTTLEIADQKDPITIEEALPLVIARSQSARSEPGTVHAWVLNPMQATQPAREVEITVRRSEQRDAAPVFPYRWQSPYWEPDTALEITDEVNAQGELTKSSRMIGVGATVEWERVDSEEKAMPEGKRLVKGRGRRDPFDRGAVLKPKNPKSGTTTFDPNSGKKLPPGADPQQIIVKLLNDERQTVQQAEELAKLSPDIAKGKIQKAYADFISVKLLLDQLPLAQPQGKELDALRLRIERVYPGAQAVVDQGLQMLKKAQGEFDEQNFSAVLQTVEEIKGLENKPELRGSDAAPAFQAEVLQPARKLEDRIKVRQEFAKIRIEITGVIYNLVETPFPVDLGVRVLGRDLRLAGTVRLPVSQSGAIVNGTAVVEGDVLDKSGALNPDLKPEDGLQVVKIRQDEVIFRYRGEEIGVLLR